jgi:phosphomevalonate kinase
MACSVELLAEVDREIDKLDAQHSKRLLKFLHARVAKLTARGLGSSGNIAWAITGSSVRSKTIVRWFCSFASEITKKIIFTDGRPYPSRRPFIFHSFSN